jgi:hypothetical protein
MRGGTSPQMAEGRSHKVSGRGREAAAKMRRNSTLLHHLHCFQSASGGPFMQIHAISGIFARSVPPALFESVLLPF